MTTPQEYRLQLLSAGTMQERLGLASTARVRGCSMNPVMTAVELTVFEKTGGPLTKRISLAANGTVKSDGSACEMSSGTARQLRTADIGELATVIEKSRSDQALALGALRDGLPDQVRVVTKKKLNGQPNTIARTAADINFRKATQALGLIDYDTKGMPPEIAEEIKRRGGFWPTLTSVLPGLGKVAHLIAARPARACSVPTPERGLPDRAGCIPIRWCLTVPMSTDSCAPYMIAAGLPDSAG